MNTEIARLRQIMSDLRDPFTGCEWDLKQDFRSIAVFTIEEAYEVLDAIEREDIDDLKDELGDLLLQVVFHSQIASEQGLFTFDDVAQTIAEKMLRRHPHVFGDTVFNSEAELKASWEAIKSEERRHKLAKKTDSDSDDGVQIDHKPSAVDGIATNLPALKRADKIQKRAARVGFDWPDIEPVWEKLFEEIAEVREAVELGEAAAIQDEIGDLLFTVVNLARHCAVDSETALRQASAKFEKRFRCVEALATKSEETLDNMDLVALDALWVKAKTQT